MSEAADELSIIERFQRGDPEAFGVLYERYRTATYDQLLRLSGDPMAAEDMLQSVFVTVWEQHASLRDPSDFAPWLSRIVDDVGVSDARRAQPASLEGEHELPSPQPGPLASLLAAERAALFRDVLSLNPPP